MVLLISLAAAADWADRIDRDRQAETLEVLSGVRSIEGGAITSRAVGHPDRERARVWLLEQLSAIDGLELAEEPFTEQGVPGVNLIATLRGRRRRLDPIVVSAHYDSTAAGEDDWDPTSTRAPGADDDASGCAAILEMARLLAAEPLFERDIELILFDAEEEGLLGSKAHVRMRTDGVHQMLSLDSIGSNTADGQLFMIYTPGAEPLSTEILAQLDAQSTTTLTQITTLDIDTSTLLSPRSDHGPFYEAGFAAAHLGQYPLPTTYHRSSDVMASVDTGFIADATATVLATVEALARQEAPRCGCSSAPSFPSWSRR